MELFQYIQTCLANKDYNELLFSWYFAGSSICNNATKFYKKGDLYIIDEPKSVFNGYMMYCNENYIGQLDWSTIKSLDEAGKTTIKDGVTAECFTFIERLDTTGVAEAAEKLKDYTPFSKYGIEQDTSTDIIIDDDQYYQIMQVVGMPFIKEREMEYNRQAILKLAIEPALRMYYTYFPIIDERTYSEISAGDFMIPYPTKPWPAYKAVAWKTTAGPITGAAAINGISPLAALGTDINLYTRAASGNRFSQGLHYNKPVPGFTGEGTGGGTSAFSELATAWPIANTMKNMMRREHLQKVNVPGKGYFAKGYSTTSGFLNITWLCWSRNFDDIDAEDWYKVLQLCQAHVKKSIGAIRGLLRTDSNLPFREGMEKEGADEIDAIEKEWKESPYNDIYTSMRGGLIG